MNFRCFSKELANYISKIVQATKFNYKPMRVEVLILENHCFKIVIYSLRNCINLRSNKVTITI